MSAVKKGRRTPKGKPDGAAAAGVSDPDRPSPAVSNGYYCWSMEEIKSFYVAFHRIGPSWAKVCKAVGSVHIGQDECEALFNAHKSYLNLDKRFQSDVAFVAMVTDSQREKMGVDQVEGALASDVPVKSGDTVSDEAGGGPGSVASGGNNAPRPSTSGVPTASQRSRRTPKPTPKIRSAQETTPRSQKAMPRTPGSGGSQQRRSAAAAAVAASSGLPLLSPGGKRKRSSTKRLSFDEDETTRPLGWRRLDGARTEDEAKGADALLSLASLVEVHEAAAAGGDLEGLFLKKEPGSAAAAAAGASAGKAGGAAAASGGGSQQPYHPQYHPGPSGGSAAAGDPLGGAAAQQLYGRGVRGGVGGSAGAARVADPQPMYGSGGAVDGSGYVYPVGGYSDGGVGLGGGYGSAPGAHLYLGDDTGRLSQAGDMPREGTAGGGMGSSGRKHRRKPAPEKLPPMVSPIKSLFLRRSSGAAFAPGAAALALCMNGGPAGTAAAAGSAEADLLLMHGAAESRLRHCLTPRVRRWAMYEFLYSALDRPWFMQDELQDFLNHVGLGNVSKMTRGEWRLMRSALGKPRRFSLRFLKEERAKLEKWRETVRAVYAEVGRGTMEGVPPHLPRPLQVGQQVTARHPATRHIHDGQVLTVESNAYRVQFERRELGVELVRDVDVMPVNPLENVPPALLHMQGGALLLNGHSFSRVRPRGRGWAGNRQQGRVGCPPDEGAASASISREALVQSIAEVNGALEKKEALLVQLRHMNDEVEAGQVDPSLPAADAFKHSYAGVVLTLKQVNQELEGGLVNLDQYVGVQQQQFGAGGLAAGGGAAGSAPLQLLMPQALPGGAAAPGGPVPLAQINAAPPPAGLAAGLGPSATGDHGAGGLCGGVDDKTGAVGLTSSAWVEAQAMVEGCRAALAADAGHGGGPAAGAGPSGNGGGQEPFNGGSQQQQPQQQQGNGDGGDGAPPNEANGGGVGGGGGDGNGAGGPCGGKGGEESGWLTQLITGCVSTLLILQQCAEGGLPPDTIREALDSALLFVRPHADANQGMYAQICDTLGQLKAQLAGGP